MPNLLSPLEACKVDLFAAEDELREKYPLALAERVLRLREMYNYWLANPSMKDRQLRDAIMSRYDVSQSTIRVLCLSSRRNLVISTGREQMRCFWKPTQWLKPVRIQRLWNV